MAIREGEIVSIITNWRSAFIKAGVDVCVKVSIEEGSSVTIRGARTASIAITSIIDEAQFIAWLRENALGIKESSNEDT